jgi:hypothetical protein
MAGSLPEMDACQELPTRKLRHCRTLVRSLPKSGGPFHRVKVAQAGPPVLELVSRRNARPVHPSGQLKSKLGAVRTLIGLVLIMTTGLAQQAGSQQVGYALVVNASNPVSSLTRIEVSNLFLRKATKWPDGSLVHPVDLPSSSPVRAAFSREIHGKSVASISSYWQQQIFSGRSVPPSERESPAEIIAYVRSDPEAIGYIPAGLPQSGVKVLQVLP